MSLMLHEPSAAIVGAGEPLDPAGTTFACATRSSHPMSPNLRYVLSFPTIVSCPIGGFPLSDVLHPLHLTVFVSGTVAPASAVSRGGQFQFATVASLPLMRELPPTVKLLRVVSA